MKTAASLFILVSTFAFSQQNDFPRLTGPYFGQKAPGMIPEVFAPGIVSTQVNEFLAVFSPDGKEFHFTRLGPRGRFLSFFSKQDEQGVWSEPAPEPFSGQYSDAVTGYSPDGARMLFVSNRPLEPGQGPLEFQNIWFVDRKNGAWGSPQIMPEPINSEARDLGATLTNNSTIYFHTTRDALPGGCRSRLEGGVYKRLEPLAELLRTDLRIFDIAVHPEEKYLIFTSMEIRDGVESMGLYVSFNKGNDRWTEPVNMGDGINSKGDENFPTLSPDAKYLFFVSNKENETGMSDIYWVDARIIDEMKNSL